MALKFIDLQNLSTFLSNLRTWIAGSDSNLVHRTGNETISGTKTFNSTIDGNAATATKLASVRTLSLYGDAEGSATFDGSANASIMVSIDEATSLAKGLMSASDKDKLDSLGAVFSFKGTVSASSGLPASGSNGDAYYVSGENAVYAYDGTNWVDLLSGVFTPITNAEVDAVFA